ncbi:hypothetical protein D3C71_1342260 [compost metagenome]
MDGFIHARRLHHAAVSGEVAVQHGQPAFVGERVGHIADAAFGTVHVQRRPTRGLAESHLRGNAGRARLVELVDGMVLRLGDIPLRDGSAQRAAMHGGHVGMQQSTACELAEDGHDAAGAMHVFDVVLLRVRRHLAQLRHAA